MRELALLHAEIQPKKIIAPTPVKKKQNTTIIDEAAIALKEFKRQSEQIGMGLSGNQVAENSQ